MLGGAEHAPDDDGIGRQLVGGAELVIAGVARLRAALLDADASERIQTSRPVAVLTAKERMARAVNSKTRLAHEQPTLQPGDQVDFYRKPATKDESGRRGPAKMAQTGPPAVIQWQDRFIQVRTQDLRRALVFLAFLAHEWCADTIHYTWT